MNDLRLVLSYSQLAVICSILLGLSLISYVALGVIWTKNKKRAKAKRWKDTEKEYRFTLPQQDNTFIRERLNGALKQDEKTRPQDAVLLKDMDLRLDYTRKTIAKLKASALSPADRLEVNRISKTVTFFALKNALSPVETRSLNDCFARLLKLSAKYAV